VIQPYWQRRQDAAGLAATTGVAAPSGAGAEVSESEGGGLEVHGVKVKPRTEEDGRG
jgi:hypothetical protein